jgi:hypothetical protein
LRWLGATLFVELPADVAIMELREGTFEFIDNCKGARNRPSTAVSSWDRACGQERRARVAPEGGMRELTGAVRRLGCRLRSPHRDSPASVGCREAALCLVDRLTEKFSYAYPAVAGGPCA